MAWFDDGGNKPPHEPSLEAARRVLASMNRPAGSGRSRRDTSYCGRCRALRPTILIRGYNGARDLRECTFCGKRWPS